MTAFRSLIGGGVAALAIAAAAQAQTIETTVKVEPGSLYQLVFNPADDTVLVAAVGPRAEVGTNLTRSREVDHGPVQRRRLVELVRDRMLGVRATTQHATVEPHDAGDLAITSRD